MSDFQILDQPLPGVYLLSCPHYPDSRGDFSKHFHSSIFENLGIPFTPAETFLTRSKLGVIRGMHFQAGEAAHDKLVFCLKGRVLDVVVDVREGSKFFNMPISVVLSESRKTALMITKGYAHGFLALDEDSWMLYYTSTVHCPSMDRGVLWSSIDFDWPIQHPLVSERDSRHPSIKESLL